MSCRADGLRQVFCLDLIVRHPHVPEGAVYSLLFIIPPLEREDMGGIELCDGTLVVDRDPNDLDDLAIRFSSILDDVGVKHVFISGYVAILAGRSRATEDIDVLLERTENDTIDRLVERLKDDEMWGPAMPLDSMAEMLDDNIWVARDGEMVPHVEAKFVDDEYDRASLDNRITARISSVGAEIPIGPLELQIAYKLFLNTPKDFEDAVHLYALFEENLRTPALEHWIEKLDVEGDYERLKRA
jgi:hypothetical protein